jgi:hypothetical protein
VLGVEGEAGVEGPDGRRRGPRAAEHVQEVGRVTEVRRRPDRLLAAPDAVVSTDGRGQLAGEADGLAQIRRRCQVGGVGIEHAEQRHRGLQRPHRVGALGHQREGPQQLLGQGAGRHQLGAEVLELSRGRQLAVPEQVGDLLERGLAGQIGDVVAAVGQAAMGAVEVAQPGLGGDHALQPADQARAFAHRGLLEGYYGRPPPGRGASRPGRGLPRAPLSGW